MKDRRVSVGISLPTEALNVCYEAVKTGKFKNISRFIAHTIEEYSNNNTFNNTNIHKIEKN